jgi:hypothetical protein
VGREDSPEGPAEGQDPALYYLGQLGEETVRHAWGEGRTPEERRRIVSAALIFGRQFERRVRESPPSLEEQDRQRFLMDLMRGVIEEFSEREGVEMSEATAFLSDVPTRDRVLELNEVLEEHAADDSGRSLDDLLRRAVEDRRERAVWAQHWSSG